jgi:hypothetical protein
MSIADIINNVTDRRPWWMKSIKCCKHTIGTANAPAQRETNVLCGVCGLICRIHCHQATPQDQPS